MKKFFFTALILMALPLCGINAQNQKYSEYYYQRVSLFKLLPIDKNDIVFIGNSITDYAEWDEIFDNPNIKNRGISGDIAQGVYDRLDLVTKGEPAKIFLMIGVNDLSRNSTADSIVRAVTKIVDKIRTDTPKTKLYVQSILPVNDIYQKHLTKTTKSDVVVEINKGLVQMCKERNLVFIDVNTSLREKGGIKLDPKYSNDGLHLMGEGYMIWKKIIEKYINE